MKKYGIITSLMGSDQLILLDGRWNKTTIYNKCVEYVNKLKKIHPNKPMNKIEICTGRILDHIVLYTINL